jgi:hypothetical protein
LVVDVVVVALFCVVQRTDVVVMNHSTAVGVDAALEFVDPLGAG